MPKRRPSPAMIIAVIALVLGLGGAAIAADLTKPQVKKIAKKVANKQIKKKAVLKSQVDNLSVAHADSADAVNGVGIHSFNAQVARDTTDAVIGTFGPVTVKGSCEGDGDVTVRASFAGAADYLFSDNLGDGGDKNNPAGATVNISSDAVAATVGDAHVVAVDGSFNARVEYYGRAAPSRDSDQCSVAGYVLTG
jgi:hypothetical protein